ETEAQEWRIERARMTERFNAFMESQTRRAEPAKEDPEPNENDDPLGHLKWENRQLKKQVQGVQQHTQAQQQQEQQVGQQQQFLQAYQSAADEFRADAPDFDDAY